MPDVATFFRAGAAVLAGVATVAQCDLEWRTAGGYPGANGIVYAATSWDPDGPGPATALVVLGGDFTIVGDAVASGIAACDFATNHCMPLGAGVNGTVRAVLALPNGDLIAAGTFTVAGGVPAANIARWNGTAWAGLGPGIAGSVHACVLLPNGDLIAGGSFAVAGWAPVFNVARWDGTAWWPLVNGTNGLVRTLAVAPNGDVIAGGDFTGVSGVAAVRIARWSNGVWQQLGSGCDNQVRGVAVLPTGEVFAAGNFTLAGGVAAAGVARWNGTTWSAASPTGFLEFGQSLSLLPSGSLVLGTQGIAKVYSWNGLAFQPLVAVTGGTLGPVAPSAIHAVTNDANGDVVVAGDFLASGSPYTVPPPRFTVRVVRVQGNQLHGLGRIDTPVCALAESTSGVVAAGSNPNIGAFGRHVDVWNGSDWAPFATMDGYGAAMAGLPNGRVLVAGNFVQSGYSPPYWTPWTAYYGVAVVGQAAPIYHSHPLSYLLPTYQIPGLAVARMPTGTLLVAFSVPVFVGSAFQYFDANGAPGGSLSAPSGNVETIAASSAGAIYAAGNIPTAGHCVHWNGTQWQPLGAGVDAPVRTLLATVNGDLIAGGDFTSAGAAPASRIARWNGTSWSPLGAGVDGPVRACIELPNSDLLVGGAFATAGGLPAANLARWNGATWSPVAGGTNGPVRALLLAADGTIWVAGDFTAAGTLGCGYIARLVTPCPAAAATVGTGCAGSGGLDVLTATSLPWQGSVFTSRATGMPALAFVVQVNGLLPINVPLNAILPQGVAGCALLTTPDVLDVYLPTAGVASFHLALPAASVLIGQTIYQQALPLELDASFAIVAVTSSNLLQLTIGGL